MRTFRAVVAVFVKADTPEEAHEIFVTLSEKFNSGKPTEFVGFSLGKHPTLFTPYESSTPPSPCSDDPFDPRD